jgi:hypothetical protein
MRPSRTSQSPTTRAGCKTDLASITTLDTTTQRRLYEASSTPERSALSTSEFLATRTRRSFRAESSNNNQQQPREGRRASKAQQQRQQGKSITESALKDFGRLLRFPSNNQQHPGEDELALTGPLISSQLVVLTRQDQKASQGEKRRRMEEGEGGRMRRISNRRNRHHKQNKRKRRKNTNKNKNEGNNKAGESRDAVKRGAH